MKAEQILQYLDEQFDMDQLGHSPPVLDNANFLLAGTRLSVFRSDKHWAMLFETVTADRSSDTCGDRSLSFYGYGNCLQGANAFEESGYMEEETRALFAWAEEEGVLNRHRFSIFLNGKRHTFTPTPQDYESARIIFDDLRQGPNDLDSKQLVRFLCHHLNHPFFASEDYLRSLLDKYRSEPEQGEPLFSSHTMTLFLQTREWQHNDGLPPSQVPGFQILARAIETGDLSDWRRQDPADFNTDWTIYETREKAWNEWLENIHAPKNKEASD